MKSALCYLTIILCSLTFLTQAQHDLSSGKWHYVNGTSDCAPMGEPGSCPQGRHEAAYVQVGDKFYLVGGRENTSNVNIYDPETDTWKEGAKPPLLLHHFQALEYQGLLYVIGAMTGNFPAEPPIENIYIYHPLNDVWYKGPEIPAARRRGSAGVVEYKGKIYVASGITNGHIDGWVPWLDEYDPRTNSWKILPDAPRSRDHFHAAVIGDNLYLAAGRRSNHSGPNGSFSDTEPLTDVYDFAENNWVTLPNPIPTERAGAAVAVVSNELLVIGGEKQPGNAHSETEALNPETGEWRTLAPLNTGRHGSQAIVNNGGVYIAAGSPTRGGGSLQSQEVFYAGEPTLPEGEPLKASTLRADKTTLTFHSAESGQPKSDRVTLTNEGGNQGILITEIRLEGDRGFRYDFPYPLPYLLHSSDKATLEISMDQASGGEKHVSVTIHHSARNEVVLSGGGNRADDLHHTPGEQTSPSDR